MIVSSAPGKVLLLGSYSVLEKGSPALVLAIGNRVEVKVKDFEKGRFLVRLSNFGLGFEGRIVNGKVEVSLREAELKIAGFVLNVIEIVYDFLHGQGFELQGFELVSNSDEVFSVSGEKSGLGSSAAVTVAAAAALMQFNGFNLKDDESIGLVHKIAQLANCLSQGKVGSGFDVASSTYGSIIYSRFSGDCIDKPSTDACLSSEWDFSIEKFSLPRNFRLVVASLDKSASTVNLASKVQEIFGKPHPQLILKELNDANVSAIRSLKQIMALENGADYNRFLEAAESNSFSNESIAFLEFKHACEKSRILTKKLGQLAGVEVESDEFTKLIEESEKNGAFVCRLPGAGGGDCIAAICLSDASVNMLESFWRSRGLKALNVNASNAGLKVEEIVQATAPCKLIIAGEHSVVYGGKAIALPVNLVNCISLKTIGLADGEGFSISFESSDGVKLACVRLEDNVLISDSEMGCEFFPAVAKFVVESEKVDLAQVRQRLVFKLDSSGFGKGFGNSSSFSACIAALLYSFFDFGLNDKRLFSAVQAGDKVAHGGKASGVDALTIVTGKSQTFFREFRDDGTVSLKFEPIQFALPKNCSLLAIVPKVNAERVQSTADLVEIFARSNGIAKQLNELSCGEREEVFKKFDSVVEKILVNLKEDGNAVELGRLFDENHELLKASGISSDLIELARRICFECGAFGSKLSGAGGNSGVVISLVSSDKVGLMKNALERNDFIVYNVEMAIRGVGLA